MLGKHRTGQWDALVLTASNAAQARRYEAALHRRQRLDLLGDVREVLVVPDPDGRRVGSAGSTIFALAAAASKLRASSPLTAGTPQGRLEALLAGLRVLIIHAGGDSRRVPAYASCGKAFIPLPVRGDSVEPITLLDRLLSVYVNLAPPPDGSGQAVIAAGDVLVMFDPADLELSGAGVCATACHATPAQAAGHGVFVAGADGLVRVFLQKPSEEAQREACAVDEFGRCMLDVGLFAYDMVFAAKLMAAAGFDVFDDGGRACARVQCPLHESPNPLMQAIWNSGLDMYREVACALGGEATWQHYVQQVRAAGSRVPDDTLRVIFDSIRDTPFNVKLLPRCRFLHFGTSRHVIESARMLLEAARPEPAAAQPMIVNSLVDGGRVTGGLAWIEGCRISADVHLDGENLLVGLNVDRPLTLRQGVALDVAPARPAEGVPGGFFVRVYGVNDTFKGSVVSGTATCLNEPMGVWMQRMRARDEDLWPEWIAEADRSLWNARVFPIVQGQPQVWDWLWMQEPQLAAVEQKDAWRQAPRFSLAEMAELVDHDAELLMRRRLCLCELNRSVARLTALDSGFSAKDLASWVSEADDPFEVVAQMMMRASECHRMSAGGGCERSRVLESVRILHSLGTALEAAGNAGEMAGVAARLQSAGPAFWAGGLAGPEQPWAFEPARLKARAFSLVAETIGSAAMMPGEPEQAGLEPAERPRMQLRSDEIVWGRAPARLDLAGGWSDTPPYTLEWGGRVVNTAVCLNSQQPIHVYVRPINEPVIRIGSIDLGKRIEVRTLEDLTDYCNATSGFALVKASLVLMGFSPQTAAWPADVTLERMLEESGAGVEISTLCAIPKGSGLGTSSILGGCVLAALAKALKRPLAGRELFNAVLRLEQMLSTGGGWQDQVGGILPGTKYASTRPGLQPDPLAYYLPSDLVCPTLNHGSTLLYYTGITRVAKNILQQVVGRYLDRDRSAMRTLAQIGALAEEMRDALSIKDAKTFGQLVDSAWRLNTALDPDSTTPEVEAILERVRRHIHGAKLLGAGGGGFLLMVCRSEKDARKVRRLLDDNPVNGRARFFGFNVSDLGLEVTIS